MNIAAVPSWEMKKWLFFSKLIFFLGLHYDKFKPISIAKIFLETENFLVRSCNGYYLIYQASQLGGSESFPVELKLNAPIESRLILAPFWELEMLNFEKSQQLWLMKQKN